jgi:hypothetical protein
MTFMLFPPQRFHAHGYLLKEASAGDNKTDQQLKAEYGVLGSIDIIRSPNVHLMFADQGSAKRVAAALYKRPWVHEDETTRDVLRRLEEFCNHECYVERFAKVVARECSFSTFILGDCWVCNMMFK